jgi:hypothetical protein
VCPSLSTHFKLIFAFIKRFKSLLLTCYVIAAIATGPRGPCRSRQPAHKRESTACQPKQRAARPINPRGRPLRSIAPASNSCEIWYQWFIFTA